MSAPYSRHLRSVRRGTGACNHFDVPADQGISISSFIIIC